MNRITASIIVFFCSLYIVANWSVNVEYALKKAGKNRASLETVLSEYSRDKKDCEKYEAACFLISNMIWHKSFASLPKYDKKIDNEAIMVDSLYYSIFKSSNDWSERNNNFKKCLNEAAEIHQKKVSGRKYQPILSIAFPTYDIELIDGKFLKRQIESAFLLRKTNRDVKNLSFNDFCEYILPYRFVGNYPYVYDRDMYTRLFDKYLKELNDVDEVVRRYNYITNDFKKLSGKYPYKECIGLPSLFYYGVLDCIDMSNYAGSTLRSLGYPAASEFTIAYKVYEGRHFYVSTKDSQNRWVSFSPESSPTIYRNPKFAANLNFFRQYFGKQQNNPFSLKGDKEYIPNDLSDPCIEDVSRLYVDVKKIQITCNINTNNKLIYLASFTTNGGLIPVTWGRYNKESQIASFENVIPDNLYFPVYYNTVGRLCGFGKPFWIHSEGEGADKYKINYIEPHNGQFVDAGIVRKYPRKPQMLEYAKKAIGTLLLASNKSDFSDADTLGRILNMPNDSVECIQVASKKPYRYYRLQSPKSDGHIRMAEVQFYTNKKYGYTNVVDGEYQSSEEVRLLDAPLDKCKWKAEYDGNVQTAPDAYPNITLRLQEPQIVSSVKYIVKNEDNRLKDNHTYQLYEWNGTKWELSFMKPGDKEGLEVKNLKIGALYWLKDITNGKEELPFIIDNKGMQVFFHDKLLKVLSDIH